MTQPLGAIAFAVLALAGCNRQQAGAGADGTVAGGGQSAIGAPGLSGSPTTATPSGAASAADLNALPPTAAGSANASSRDAGGTTQTLSASDRRFVTEAAGGAMFEIKVSQLAATKAVDAAVKQFAQMLVTDHSNANDELKTFASAHNVTLSTELPKNLQAELDKLKKTQPGADFDKQYVQTVGLKDHKDDIAKFEKASKDAQSPQLKAWIDKTLPTLKEHLAAAQKLPGAGATSASK
jgi:putative membrane protein